MPRMRITSTGDLVPADRPRRDTRRGRHLEPGRRFRSTGAYQRLRAQVFREEPACAICGSEDDPHMDHIIPVSKGGPRLARMNVRRMCGRCNARRGVGVERSLSGAKPHPGLTLAAVRTVVEGD